MLLGVLDVFTGFLGFGFYEWFLVGCAFYHFAPDQAIDGLHALVIDDYFSVELDTQIVALLGSAGYVQFIAWPIEYMIQLTVFGAVTYFPCQEIVSLALFVLLQLEQMQAPFLNFTIGQTLLGFISDKLFRHYTYGFN